MVQLRTTLRGRVKMLAIEDAIKKSVYGKKAAKLCVSNYIITGRRSDNSIDIFSMIKNSDSKEEFRRFIKDALLDDRETDYLHMSLISGLFFGCYNLYDYMHIVPEVRKKIVSSNPNREDTFEFISKHLDSITLYFKEKYNIDEDIVVKILNKMFFVNNSEEDRILLYSNFIIRDMHMILMGRALTDRFISCDGAIRMFLYSNEKGLSKLKFDKIKNN